MRLLLLFSAFVALTSLTAQEKNYQALDLDPLLTKNANAIVRLDEMRINVLSNRSMNYEVQQAVTVLNKNGNQNARTRLYYDKEKKIKNIEAFVYDKHGEEIKRIKKKDFQDLSAADGFSLYRDDRLLYYRYTPTQYPYTLVFNYEVETSDTGFFPPWYFISGYKVSVEKSYFEINYANASVKPEIKEYNLTDFDYSKTDESGKIIYQAENIQAFKYEELGPGFSAIAPRLKTRLKNFTLKGVEATVSDWNDLGAWIDNKLLKNQDELPESTKSTIKDLVKGVDDQLEKAKIVYQFVQDNTRYISVQIGIGGWRPISAIEVDKVKYGDCKGLSNYTKALMNYVGVEANYVVVHAGNAKLDFDEDFSVLQGNHAILAIPYKGEYYWIDCTSQVNPFGFIGDFTDDRNVLVVKPNGGEIVKTTAYLNDQNKQNTTASYTVSSDGSINANVKITTTGVQYDHRFHLNKDIDEDIEKHYKNYWSNINNLNINSFAFDNNKEEVIFEEVLDVDAKAYASLSQDRMIFVLNAFNRTDFVPKRYRERKRSFVIQRGYLDIDSYKISIPEGYSVESLPDSQTITSEFGEYTFNVKSEEDGSLKYEKSFLLKAGKFSASEYKDYRDFRKKVAKLERTKVVLITKE